MQFVPDVNSTLDTDYSVRRISLDRSPCLAPRNRGTIVSRQCFRIDAIRWIRSRPANSVKRSSSGLISFRFPARSSAGIVVDISVDNISLDTAG